MSEQKRAKLTHLDTQIVGPILSLNNDFFVPEDFKNGHLQNPRLLKPIHKFAFHIPITNIQICQMPKHKPNPTVKLVNLPLPVKRFYSKLITHNGVNYKRAPVTGVKRVTR